VECRKIRRLRSELTKSAMLARHVNLLFPRLSRPRRGGDTGGLEPRFETKGRIGTHHDAKRAYSGSLREKEEKGYKGLQGSTLDGGSQGEASRVN